MKYHLGTLVAFAFGLSACVTEPANDPEFSRWCDQTYHQNPGCPQHGQVEIPPEELARQKADEEAWCDEIHHQNVSCPKHCQVEVPLDVLLEDAVNHVSWCIETAHANVSCPLHGQGSQYATFPTPSELYSDAMEHVHWCVEHDHPDETCPVYCPDTPAGGAGGGPG